MIMNDLVYKIKSSQPSLVGNSARLILLEAIISNKYVVFHSTVLGLEKTLQIASVYVNTLATVELADLGILHSFQPIHTLHYISPGKIPYENWGLLYSNGSVLYSEYEQTEPKLIVLMDKLLSKEYGFPTKEIQIKT